ncbi:hypothetical protein DYB32_006750 [Aphanomyces invadans]|uniref:Uncharacterized protein n=1 Tax=Aphanomyces invadans TaxID=157072 RepID=A0A3R6YW58_9STRA|nr:hypothetical protein DYB32_006750 [Aphanomyces invadans]
MSAPIRRHIAGPPLHITLKYAWTTHDCSMRTFTLVAAVVCAAVFAHVEACPFKSPKKSMCWCDASMNKPKTVGDCDSANRQHFHQSAHNAKTKGAKFYLCCDKTKPNAYCLTIAQAVSCGFEQGIAFY